MNKTNPFTDKVHAYTVCVMPYVLGSRPRPAGPSQPILPSFTVIVDKTGGGGECHHRHSDSSLTGRVNVEVLGNL